MECDVCIIGLGAMGSATAWRLAEAGVSVVALEQFELGHARGSSHGDTRAIRSVYFEGGLYEGLVEAAYADWDAIAEAHGRRFLTRTGGLDISLVRGGIFEAARDAAEAAGAEHEVLEGAALTERYPYFDFHGREARAVYAPDTGLLLCAESVAWFQAEASRLGARLVENCAVGGWRKEGGRYVVETDGEPVRADRLVVAAGGWIGRLFPNLVKQVVPERQVLAWFDAPGLEGSPLYHLESEAGRHYIFPPFGGRGAKAGLYHHREERGEASAFRGVDETDVALIAEGLTRSLPDPPGPATGTMECIFTIAPDNRFIIGPWPEDEGVILLSPCSGHGFKFTPAIGRAAAELAMGRATTVEVGQFGVREVLGG
jgi:sarcosine oxidase